MWLFLGQRLGENLAHFVFLHLVTLYVLVITNFWIPLWKSYLEFARPLGTSRLQNDKNLGDSFLICHCHIWAKIKLWLATLNFLLRVISTDNLPEDETLNPKPWMIKSYLCTYQCDQKKSPNVYKSCPKVISQEKW